VKGEVRGGGDGDELGFVGRGTLYLRLIWAVQGMTAGTSRARFTEHDVRRVGRVKQGLAGGTGRSDLPNGL